MKLSLVIPSYNHAPFLGQCLDSVLDQESRMELEVIVMDGGSDDGSREIIEAHAARLAYWESGSDGGQTDALIRGFGKSTGDVMGWLNSDDMLLPGTLEIVRASFEEGPGIDVIYGDMELIDLAGKCFAVHKEIDFDSDILLWTYDYIPQPSTFWRRRIWERSGGLRSEFQCAMDYDLWMRFAAHDAHFQHVPHVLSRFRVYPEQKNQRLRATSDAEDRRIREEFLGRHPGMIETALKYSWHRGRRIMKRLVAGDYGVRPE